MKILFVVNDLKFFISHRNELAIHANELKWEVFVLGPNPNNIKTENLDFNFLEFNFNRSSLNLFKALKASFYFYKKYKELNPNIIHQITLKPIIFGSLFKRFLSKKIVFVNAIAGLGTTFTKKSFLEKFLKILFKTVLNSKDNFIFQNESDLNIFKNIGLINDNYIITNGSGVDKISFPYVENTKKEKLKVILTARMLKEKGIYDFYKAAVLLKEKYYDKVSFEIWGPIDDQNPSGISEEELAKLEMESYFKWYGSTEDVLDKLIDSDIYCLPTFYGEGIPKSIIEAMAIGRPIVTTNIAGCDKCVINNSNGFLVDIKSPHQIANKLDILLSDYNLILEMGIKSRKHFEDNFTLEKVVNQTFDFYNRLIVKN